MKAGISPWELPGEVRRRDELLAAAYLRQRVERISKTKPKSRSKRFLVTPEWKALRLECLRVLGEECCKCGSTENPNVDHVQSRFYSPDLSLRLSNLQILCKGCNFEKGTQSIDYRTKRQFEELLRAESQ